MYMIGITDQPLLLFWSNLYPRFDPIMFNWLAHYYYNEGRSETAVSQYHNPYTVHFLYC